MTQKEKNSISLVKTDYDDFKDLSFFLEQQRKAEAMLREVEDFKKMEHPLFTYMADLIVRVKDLNGLPQTANLHTMTIQHTMKEQRLQRNCRNHRRKR